MTEKIGVYVCECGPNIKDAMDLETVVKFAQDLEGVVFAKTFRTLCSEDGKNLITKDIKDNNLTCSGFSQNISNRPGSAACT